MVHTLEDRARALCAFAECGCYREAARRTGISFENIRRWERAGLYATLSVKKEVAMDKLPDELPDNPEELKRIIHDQQLEIDLMKAVVDIVKKGPGVDLTTLTNREKTMLVDALRPTYSLTCLANRLDLARSSYHYWHKVLSQGDRLAWLRPIVADAFDGLRRLRGYRAVHRRIREDGIIVSEKLVRRVMREDGLIAYGGHGKPSYSSYDRRADSEEGIPNFPLREDGKHDFTAALPNMLWTSDVTMFVLPCGARVYLSPVIDCFDEMVIGRRASTSSKVVDLTGPSFEEACAQLRAGEHPVSHSDRGVHYHALSHIAMMEAHGITRSMSRKATSPDNARMEGFFGLLKREFFYPRDWRGVSTERFIEELYSWIDWYNEERPKESLGWLSPRQYRRSLGYSC